MALTQTARAALESKKTRIEPQLVLEIEGVATLFGAVKIMRVIRIGDPGLIIGGGWKIGGLTAVDDQADVISFEAGTGTKIDQQLQPDKGSVNSVSSIQVGLVDRDLIATKLISPGVVVDDILGRKAILWMGFKNTAFKEDYVPVLSGVIDDVESGAGTVKINIAHPEQLKRQELFQPVDVELSAGIDSGQTSIALIDAASVLIPTVGANGTLDDAIKYYVKVEDEFIRYTGVSGNTLTGCTRGELGSIGAAHTPSPDPITGKTLVRLTDTAINCALKFMLSGNGDAFANLSIKKFLHPLPFETVPNSVFFFGIDLNRDYGVTVGDLITITDATVPANNCVQAIIQEVVTNDSGSYAVVGGVTFAEEPMGSVAQADFYSQYDTLGIGLGLTPDQVDVNEHIFWRNFQLAGYQYDFIFQDKINGKDFLDKEVYLPIGAYSIPRQGRCSMGYHVGPVVRGKLKVLSRDNIKNPDKIRLKRNLGRNFYNLVSYKFDKLAATEKFVSGSLVYSADSQNRIPVGNRPLSINSSGMRRELDGQGIAERVSARYLGRYRFAAEYVEALGVLFRDGYDIEPGDQLLFDPTGLHVSNTVDGTRDKPAKVFNVTNKSLDTKTGDVSISITDTNFDETERYGSVSPSSEIVSGDTLSIVIRDSFGAFFPGNESLKWADYVGLPIIVHSPDWSFEETVTLKEIDPSNKYRLILDPSTPLSTAPMDGYIVDIGSYPLGADPSENALYKAVHAFLGATIAVVAATDDTHFEIAPADDYLFKVGGTVRVHNPDYSDDSGELTITEVMGQVVTVASSMGFTPTTEHVIDTLDFPDGGKTYRIF